MITKQILEQMQSHFEMMDKQRKFYEDQAIISILKFFGIPEHKSERMKCIPDFLEKDNILIMTPRSIFDTIDFTKLSIPKRLRFMANLYSDEWIVVGSDDFKPERLEIRFNNNESHRLASFGRQA